MGKAKTLADFRAAHDKNVIVPSRIKAALASLLKDGKDNWCYELEFLKIAGLSTTDLGMFRDQFLDHIVETGGKTPKRVWFASADIARKVREGAL